ncbi:MAG: transposase family protein [Planctomycetota bacterium]
MGEEALMRRLEAKGEPHARRLVRWALSGLKAKRRQRLAAAAAKMRLSLVVEEKDVIWSLDATHLGKREEGGKLMSQVLVDVQDGSVLAASLGPPPRAEDALGLLEEARRLRGGLPLVLSIDNGYATRALERYAEKAGVILLVNLPQTPQHNCWVERAIRSLKDGLRELLDLKALRGERGVGLRELVLAMRSSVLGLNERARVRGRARGAGERANDRDGTSSELYDRELRRQLAGRLAARLMKIPTERCSVRRQRLLGRFATFETLLEAGLVSLTRGGRAWEGVRWEELA